MLGAPRWKLTLNQHPLKSRSLTRTHRAVRDDRFMEIASITNYFAFFPVFFFNATLPFDLDAVWGLGGAE
jgi:hypothetical protein